MAVADVVVIPYAPRPLQQAIHDAMEQSRFGVVVCHRRFGKTVCAINHLQRAALLCTKPRPRFGYIAPTYTQGKAIAWDYMKHYAAPLPHGVNESELRIDFPNDAQIRIFGADNPDSLRGLYFDGVVLDEYGLMPPKTFSEVVRQTLADRQGWALFMGTPNGKNEFYRLIHGDAGWGGAAADPSWFYASSPVSETKLIADDELKSARQAMTEDEYLQEYECSFEASVKGAIFAREVQAALEQGRITRVPYDPAYPVDTDWDLGVGDATAIWFSQTIPGTGEIRVIDFYEAQGQGLPHYKQVLTDRGYTYRDHWAPHDIENREFSSGNSRLATARQLGLNFRVCPKVDHLEDGIHAARLLFPRCWFDRDKCLRGVEALQHYRWAPRRTQDPTGKPLPVHDWASHAADAFRGLAFRHYNEKHNPERIAAKETRRAQRDDGERFRWTTGPMSARRGGY